jgi:hypothetical protein
MQIQVWSFSCIIYQSHNGSYYIQTYDIKNNFLIATVMFSFTPETFCT